MYETQSFTHSYNEYKYSNRHLLCLILYKLLPYLFDSEFY